MMVRISSIVFLSVSLLLSVVFPIIAAIILQARLRFAWRSVLVGALMFLVFQLFIRTPLLTYLQKSTWFAAFATSSPATVMLLAAFSAGLFEETGRYIGFRFLLHDFRDWRGGIAYGIGHGGLESLSIGTAFLNDLVFAARINAGNTISVPTSVVSTLTSTSPPMLAVGGIERVLAFIVQLGLSLIVLYGIRSRRPALFFLLAVALHTLLDFGAGVLYGKGALLAELFLALFAAASLVWIFLARRHFAGDGESGSQQN